MGSPKKEEIFVSFTYPANWLANNPLKIKQKKLHILTEKVEGLQGGGMDSHRPAHLLAFMPNPV